MRLLPDMILNSHTLISCAYLNDLHHNNFPNKFFRKAFHVRRLFTFCFPMSDQKLTKDRRVHTSTEPAGLL